jgi:hypothetical protein
MGITQCCVDRKPTGYRYRRNPDCGLGFGDDDLPSCSYRPSYMYQEQHEVETPEDPGSNTNFLILTPRVQEPRLPASRRIHFYTRHRGWPKTIPQSRHDIGQRLRCFAPKPDRNSHDHPRPMLRVYKRSAGPLENLEND